MLSWPHPMTRTHLSLSMPLSNKAWGILWRLAAVSDPLSFSCAGASSSSSRSRSVAAEATPSTTGRWGTPSTAPGADSGKRSLIPCSPSVCVSCCSLDRAPCREQPRLSHASPQPPQISQKILEKFPSGVEVDGESTPGVSGWLEVEVNLSTPSLTSLPSPSTQSLPFSLLLICCTFSFSRCLPRSLSSCSVSNPRRPPHLPESLPVNNNHNHNNNPTPIAEKFLETCRSSSHLPPRSSSTRRRTGRGTSTPTPRWPKFSTASLKR